MLEIKAAGLNVTSSQCDFLLRHFAVGRIHVCANALFYVGNAPSASFRGDQQCTLPEDAAAPHLPLHMYYTQGQDQQEETHTVIHPWGKPVGA